MARTHVHTHTHKFMHSHKQAGKKHKGEKIKFYLFLSELQVAEF